jgi:hypothetical protein
MKQLLLLSLLFLLSKSTFSQDTIVMLSGKLIAAKVLEINSTEVKYKKYEMPDGPDYIEEKSKIKLIRYKNGTIDNMVIVAEKEIPSNPTNPQKPPVTYDFLTADKKKYTYNGAVVGESKMYKIMLSENDPELKGLVKKAKIAKGVQFIGYGAIPAGAICIGAFVSAALADNFATTTSPGSSTQDIVEIYQIEGTVAAVATVALAATGICFSIRHTNLKAKAVKIYNERY